MQVLNDRFQERQFPVTSMQVAIIDYSASHWHWAKENGLIDVNSRSQLHKDPLFQEGSFGELLGARRPAGDLRCESPCS